MNKKIIHVNRHNIAFNAKFGKPVLPTYIIREGNKKAIYGFGFKVNGILKGIDPRKHKPLKCGARAWLETDAEIEIINPMSFEESENIRKSIDKFQLDKLR